MYYFIFEKPLDKKLIETARSIENEVTTQGIAGELIELNSTRNIDTLISDAHQKGYQTLVVVGGSKLINQVAARLLRYEIVLGVIPLGQSPALEKKLNVHDWAAAIVALKQRRWQYASLGRINDTGTFFTDCTLALPYPTTVIVETKKFSVKIMAKKVVISTRSTALKKHLVSVECYSAAEEPTGWRSWFKGLSGQPTTDYLSRFSGETITLRTDDNLAIQVDNSPIGRTPATLTIIPKALRLIVAKRLS